MRTACGTWGWRESSPTFHAAALRQLGYFWPRVVGGQPPALLEHKAALVADARPGFGSRWTGRRPRPRRRDRVGQGRAADPETYQAAATKAGRENRRSST
jgi:DNA helicase-2/ATP-dependent DNA helicase PcrA